MALKYCKMLGWVTRSYIIHVAARTYAAIMAASDHIVSVQSKIHIEWSVPDFVQFSKASSVRPDRPFHNFGASIFLTRRSWLHNMALKLWNGRSGWTTQAD